MAPYGTPTRPTHHRDNTAKPVRIVVMGATKVGKTAVIHRYLNHIFLAEHTETIEDLHTKHDAHAQNDSGIAIEILDTSGAISFPDMRRVAIKSADAIMLVFSVQDERSYDQCLDIRQEVLDIRSDIPIVFVANHIDCGSERVMDRETIELTVDIELDCPYVEVSAKTGENIDSAFVTCINHIAK